MRTAKALAVLRAGLAERSGGWCEMQLRGCLGRPNAESLPRCPVCVERSTAPCDWLLCPDREEG